MTISFRIHYNTVWGERLVLVASDVKYPMEWSGNGIWEVTVPDFKGDDLSSYGYIVERDGITVRTEWDRHSRKADGRTRRLEIEDSWIECPAGSRFTRKHQAEIFDRPGWRGAGTAVPVFSLRSKDDFGIGDFRDLRALVDWVHKTGQTVIQLLPVNDTTRAGGWEDSYPYSPVSSFALHPLYLRLQDLGIREDEAFRREQAALNALPEIDYPRVFEAKMARVRKAWESRGKKDLAGKAFHRFYSENAAWLGEYCEFCSRRDGLESEYYAWMQFHLDRQLGEEVAYARSKGVHLKGDLPIGVSRDSADAFWHPELFNLDSSAGAPPDFFSTEGQNWGFPTYNWDAMAADGYAWWKARLRHMSQYFDAFRIDHILGFFRIWEIPVEYEGGRMGHFNPALPYSYEELQRSALPIEGLFLEDPRNPGMFQPMINPDTDGLEQWQKERFEAIHTDFFFHRNDGLWRRNAEKKLPELLGATGMLACGEDLGMVPDCVADVMAEERILSLEMPMMDKGRAWPELAVCATSSHDMETLRMQKGDPRPWECRRPLWESLDSAPMLAIFPIQDWLSLDGLLRRKEYMDERVNEPADPHHHWRFRLHIDLSQLMGATALNSEIEGLLKDSRRYNNL